MLWDALRTEDHWGNSFFPYPGSNKWRDLLYWKPCPSSYVVVNASNLRGWVGWVLPSPRKLDRCLIITPPSADSDGFSKKFFFDLWPIFGRRIAPTPTPTIPTDCISQVLPETCSKLKSSNFEIFSDWRPNSWGQFLSSNMTHRVLGFQRDLSSNYRTP